MLISHQGAAAAPRTELPGPDKLPGHWLLASLGKRVLRPGGLNLTRGMLQRLDVAPDDDVVEFAPGLGLTAEMVLRAHPRTYTAIERDQSAACRLADRLHLDRVRCIPVSAESTGLPDAACSVVYGEAMLSMQTPQQKLRIVSEAHRLLKHGGRYAIHELCLLPDAIDSFKRREIEREMSLEIHVGVQPLTAAEWRSLLHSAGFEVVWERRAPMRLLEPRRLLQDEGIRGAARVAFNLVRKPAARRRVARMRALFRKYNVSLSAIALICEKP